MISIPGFHGPKAFTVLVWLGTTVSLIPNWAQTPGEIGPGGSLQSASPVAPNSTDQKPSESGVWHHFGESPIAPSPTPRPSGEWRRFGEGNNAPSHPQGFQTWRSKGLNRIQGQEQLMYGLVNRDRADPANTLETNGRGLPLRWNDRLAAVARAHSLYMLKQGYFAHEDLRGGSVATRVEAAGIKWQSVGENIAIYGSAARAEAAFMSEPRFRKNHRANILNSSFTDVGIGIVQAPDGRLYITQDFYSAPSHPGAR